MTARRHRAPLGTCDATGKAQFTKAHAVEVARALRRRDHSATQPYRCGSCGRWHVGHRSPGRRRRGAI